MSALARRDSGFAEPNDEGSDHSDHEQESVASVASESPKPYVLYVQYRRAARHPPGPMMFPTRYKDVSLAQTVGVGGVVLCTEPVQGSSASDFAPFLVHLITGTMHTGAVGTAFAPALSSGSEWRSVPTSLPGHIHMTRVALMNSEQALESVSCKAPTPVVFHTSGQTLKEARILDRTEWHSDSDSWFGFKALTATSQFNSDFTTGVNNGQSHAGILSWVDEHLQVSDVHESTVQDEAGGEYKMLVADVSQEGAPSQVYGLHWHGKRQETLTLALPFDYGYRLFSLGPEPVGLDDSPDSREEASDDDPDLAYGGGD